MKGETPTVCVPDPSNGTCVAPYVDHADVNGGGPYNYANATSDVNGGQMNGFIGQAETPVDGVPTPSVSVVISIQTGGSGAPEITDDQPCNWTLRGSLSTSSAFGGRGL